MMFDPTLSKPRSFLCMRTGKLNRQPKQMFVPQALPAHLVILPSFLWPNKLRPWNTALCS
jgi:hypothetical protein